MPNKFTNILKALYTKTLRRSRMDNHVSPLFQSTSGVKQGYPLFLFNFAIDDIPETAFKEVHDGGEMLLPGKNC